MGRIAWAVFVAAVVFPIGARGGRLSLQLTTAPATSGGASHSWLTPYAPYDYSKKIKTPSRLLRAILHGQVDDARQLLDKGVSARATYHRTVPYLAIAASLKSCNPAMLNLLIAHGANPNGNWVRIPKGGSASFRHVIPLAEAAGVGSDGCVETLLKHGAKPNVTDQMGMTPLGAAAASRYCKKSIIKMLVEGGADPNFRPRFGELPHRVRLEILDQYSNMPRNQKLAIAESLWPVLKTPPLMRSASRDLPGCAKALIDAGADVNATIGGDTVLMTAVGVGRSPAITAMLLRAGASVHAHDGRGETALFSVITRAPPPYCKKCAEMLISAGANVDTIRENGDTPLIDAASKKSALPVIRVLVKAGADVNYRNPHTGVTPLLAAALSRSLESASYLLQHGADPCVADKRHRMAAKLLPPAMNAVCARRATLPPAGSGGQSG